jgi:flagella basal body P-ring formation protein FlgA
MDHIAIGKKTQTLGAISTPISALIGDKLKQLIWKDQYIDLALLLQTILIKRGSKHSIFRCT